MAKADIYADGVTFSQQHGDYRLRRAVAEQLTQRFLVPGNTVLVDQGDEIVLGVARQGRFAEMRIGGQEVFRFGIQVGEIAPPTA